MMGGGDPEKCPDGLPRHKVTLSEGFWISDEPVRTALFKRFWAETGRGDADVDEWRGFVLGVSWEEAAAFCKWLSRLTGESYRLPTEAEWEYTARNSRRLKVDRMCDSHIREWCYDWYAPYTDEEVTDPAGPVLGKFRCIRGGYLDNPARYNEEPLELWMRCALPPDYRHYREDHFNDFGRHFIGFRVVRGPEPCPSGLIPVDLASAGVHDTLADKFAKAAPPADKPYFRKRFVMTVPPDNATNEEITAAGLTPVFRHHHHSPGFTACPNGDLLTVIYSTYHEYDAESGLAGIRLRRGCDEWEMPDMFINPVGVNDHAPLLYTSRDGKITLFWGWQQFDNSFPFQYMSSDDSGRTWGPVQFPEFVNRAERVVRQPVNTCIEGSDGYFYVVCDSSGGPCSVLWRGHYEDGRMVWEDPQGRTAGRHTTAVELKDGSILALGGKNSDIDGYMPQAVSHDHGESFEVSKTPFTALNSGQRPCVQRLMSGRLVMCGDYQDKLGRRPAGSDHKGSYVAWSDDEGQSWHFKQLWGAQGRKRQPYLFDNCTTLGYSVLRQSPDGLIHIIATNVHPILHLEFNEAWLLAAEEEAPSEAELMKSMATCFPDGITEFKEYFPDGSLRAIYCGGIADDGRFLLEGDERYYYPEGTLMSEGHYHLGRRTGMQRLYDRDGSLRMSWHYDEAGEGCTYYTYHPHSGLPRTISRFRGKMADGVAQELDRSGKVIREVRFENGRIVERKDLMIIPPSPIGEIIDTNAN